MARAENPRERLDAWLSELAPEGQRLEFKQELHLNKSGKLEVLKDITAMGNGGGGTLVFGVVEDAAGDESVAAGIQPLTDTGLPERVTDLVADVVRPTLQWRHHRVPVDHGYVWILDIDPSPLGPYMSSYGGENRFWRRHNDQARPMERDRLADLFATAERWRHDRERIWADSMLPIARNWGPDRPYLSIAGIPVAEHRDAFDPARTHHRELVVDSTLSSHSAHNRLAGTGELMSNAQVWSGGFFSEINAYPDGFDGAASARPQVRLRVHRDGAAAIAANVVTGERLDPIRMANSYLAYLGGLWTSRGVRAVELRVRFDGFAESGLSEHLQYPAAAALDGAPEAAISLLEVVAVPDLLDPALRHETLQRLAHQLANAFGERRQDRNWLHGRLYRPEGRTLLRMVGPMIEVDQANGFYVNSNSSVRPAASFDLVGWWSSGALLDVDGDLLATLEFPTLAGLPIGFALTDVDPDGPDDVLSYDRQSPPPDLAELEAPPCSGRWATLDRMKELRLAFGP